MARIFENTIVEEPVDKKPALSKIAIAGLVFVFLVIATMFTVSLTYLAIPIINREKKEKINNRDMLVEVIEMENNSIMTQKVKYETSKKTDPDDTSDIFFEVINGNEKYPVGTLVKFPHRYLSPVEIEGKTYYPIEMNQIQFKINLKDVKTDLLKR